MSHLDGHRYDVAIVGAGPGGAATAAYAAEKGLDVLLLDRAGFPRDKTCGDGLTPRAQRVLHEMGILDEALGAGHRLTAMEIVAPTAYQATTPMLQRDPQTDGVAVVPRLILDELIVRRAEARGARLETPVRVTDVVPDGAEGDGVRLTAERQGGGREVEFRARMAVIATGAGMGLLRRIGLLEQPPRLLMLSARAYFSDIPRPLEEIGVHFAGVTLPGYGWVFPLDGDRANIGAGVFRPGRKSNGPRNGQQAFARFVASPHLARALSGARQVGPVKAAPLRLDFATAPTYGPRTLLVGEAAGLVSPVTGEGIDYALESGKIAAEHLHAMLTDGDCSEERLRAYDRELRRRYQRLFVLCNRLRWLFLNPWVLTKLVVAADRHPDLMDLCLRIVLENEQLADAFRARTVLQVLLTRTRAAALP
ncbi:MAG TPA: geranylgeranyl reductase family protein [Thermomicrobiaceae bacterium]|nr:geranylgeranyl reductase family protein [Thermomicrobiaceae bacterium]